MDRPWLFDARLRIGGILTLAALASVGCRSTKSEVPAGRPYARTGTQPPAVGFSSEPRPTQVTAASTFNLGPGGGGDDALVRAGSKKTVFGTPTTGEKVSRPTTNDYGPPGTTGVDRTAGATPGDLADQLMDTGESTSKSLSRDLKVNPPTDEQ